MVVVWTVKTIAKDIDILLFVMKLYYDSKRWMRVAVVCLCTVYDVDCLVSHLISSRCFRPHLDSLQRPHLRLNRLVENVD